MSVCPLKANLPPGSYGFDWSKIPSKYLFVSNFAINPSKSDASILHKIFQNEKFSLVKIFNTRNKNCVNVEFDNVQIAEKVVEKFSNFPCDILGGKILKLRYSAPKKVPNIPFLNQIECVCESKNVNFPKGLHYFDDFINKNEEKILMEEIDNSKWLSEFGRRTQHYGHIFNYVTRLINSKENAPKIPENFTKIMNGNFSLKSEIDCFKNEFQKIDQITINEYNPGEGIRYHIDSHSSFGDFIFILSLNSPITMTFRTRLNLKSNQKNQKNQNFSDKINSFYTAKKSIFLKRRSLLILSKSSRFDWEHGISMRKKDRFCDGNFDKNGIIERGRRISLTFRKIRKEKFCDCTQKEFCDVINNCDSDFLKTPQIEKQLVHNVYDAIATHFSFTRERQWPQVVAFLRKLPKGSLVADVACGNGKYFDVVEGNSIILGFDICRNLLKIAQTKKSDSMHDEIVSDALKIPLKSNTANATISIALFHHFSTIARRRAAAKELLRITARGGQILVCAWAFEQYENSPREFRSQDCLVEWNLQRKHIEKGEEEKIGGICEGVDCAEKTLKVPRFCHVFKKGELEAVFKGFSECRVEKVFFDKGNWCVLVNKFL